MPYSECWRVFIWWIKRREARHEPVLVHPSIFRHRAIAAGLPVLSTQTFAQAGLLFLIPGLTQSILGFDAFQTGLTLLSLSIGVLVASVTPPRLGRVTYPKYIIQSGLVLLFVGGFVLARSLKDATEGTDLALGLLIGGVAIGLIAGQLPNMILSGVEPRETSEASGLQGTAQNLGMALGTAVIGTVVLSVALTSIDRGIQESDVMPDDPSRQIEATLESGLVEPGKTELSDELAQQPAEVQAEAEHIFEAGTLDGFQGALMAGGIVALFGALVLSAFRSENSRWTPKRAERNGSPRLFAIRRSGVSNSRWRIYHLLPTSCTRQAQRGW